MPAHAANQNAEFKSHFLYHTSNPQTQKLVSYFLAESQTQVDFPTLYTDNGPIQSIVNGLATSIRNSIETVFTET